MERVRRLIMNREDIGFFKAVLESYEEVALLTVVDGKGGVVERTYPAAMEDVVGSIILSVGKKGVVFREERDVR